MASRFHNITKEEMDQLVIEQWKFEREQGGKAIQIVYRKSAMVNGKAIVCRIYSGINPDGNSRAIGEDAINIQFYYEYDGKLVKVGKPRKCLRVKNWANNIEKALREMKSSLTFCPKCGHPQVWRDKGEFFGCSTYHKTKCNGKPSES